MRANFSFSNVISPLRTCTRKFKSLLSRINAQYGWRTPLHIAVVKGGAATVKAIIVAADPKLIDVYSVGYPINPVKKRR